MKFFSALIALTGVSALAIRRPNYGLHALSGEWYLEAITAEAHQYFEKIISTYHVTCDCYREVYDVISDTHANVTSTCTLRALDKEVEEVDGIHLSASGEVYLVEETAKDQLQLTYSIDEWKLVFTNGSLLYTSEEPYKSDVYAQFYSTYKSDDYNALTYWTDDICESGHDCGICSFAFFRTPNVDDEDYNAVIHQFRYGHDLVRIHNSCSA